MNKYEQKFKESQELEKARIKAIDNRSKRFWSWVWYYIAFPFKWCFTELRDWKTLLLFGVVMLVIGCEVWVPLLLGIIFNNEWLLGIAATCEAFWLAPFTPFLPLCIGITMGIKALFYKIK